MFYLRTRFFEKLDIFAKNFGAFFHYLSKLGAWGKLNLHLDHAVTFYRRGQMSPVRV